MLPTIGRDQEIREVEALLRRGIVGVWGSAGIGKTTLLDAVSARWEGPVVRARGGVEELSRALGLGDGSDLRRAVEARPGLLVVVDDATGIPPLERLPVLLASRSRLEGASELALGPLADSAATELYRAAARRVAPGLAPEPGAVDRLCRALRGHPLAIAVAGSRVRTLRPDDPGLLSRLAREGPVARMLAETLASLDPEARLAIARLARFEAGFDAAAAEEAAGAGPELLEGLLDLGLVVADGAGLRLPALVREHLERPASERHDRYVVEEGRRRLEEWRRTGRGQRVEAWRAELASVALGGAAHALDAALLLAQLPAAPGTPLDLFAGLEVPPERLARVTLARARGLRPTFQHEAALALLSTLPAELEPVLAKVAAMERLYHLGSLHRLDEAEALVPDLQRSCGSAEHDAEAAVVEATLHHRRRRTEEALQALRRASALADRAGSAELRARVWAHLGSALRTEDPESSKRFLDLALQAYAEFGDERWQGIVSQWAGVLAADQGDLERAVALQERSAAHCARAGLLPFEANARIYLAGAHLQSGDLGSARAALRAAEAVPETSSLARATLRAYRGLLAHREGQHGEACEHYEAAIRALSGLERPGSVATWRAFAALASASAGRSPEEHLAGLRELVATLGSAEAPLLRVVEAHLAGGLSEAERRAVAGSGRSDLRLLLELARPGGVICEPDGSGLVLPDGSEVSLASRPILVRLLAALVRAGPGSPLTREELLAAGWPGQTLVGASGQARLHVAVSTLRKSGLPLVTRQEPSLSYALDPSVRVRGA